MPLSSVIDMGVADQGLPKLVGDGLKNLSSVGDHVDAQQTAVVTSWFPSWGSHPAQEMGMSGGQHGRTCLDRGLNPIEWAGEFFRLGRGGLGRGPV